MIKHSVSITESGRTVERIILSNYNIDRNSFYKALRSRQIKINGKRISSNDVLSVNDTIEAYIAEKTENTQHFYTVLYENEHTVIVSKEQGIPVQDDKNHEYTLIDAVRSSFGNSCELCHRIDRNTGGIVIIAKNSKDAALIKEAINRRCYEKQYRCIVYGDARSCKGTKRAWHFKDSRTNKVYIYPDKRKYAKEIITEITAVEYDKCSCTSDVSINLITGRTHQIRAHMAYMGHPVICDGKYGLEDINKKYKYRYQALWACGLIPSRKDEAFNTGLLPEKMIYSKPDFK